jgi:hypothetical protein
MSLKDVIEAPASFSEDAAAQYVHDFVEVDGLRFPAKRRAYLRADGLQPRRDHLMVSIDLKDFGLGQLR